MINDDQLRRIMPNLPQAKRAAYLPFLQQAMEEFGITTALRQAAFLAQIAHESGEFRWMEEIASGAAYEGRRDLGNTQPGDGRRFKGRGPIQITGRANYRTYGDALGLDLVSNPPLAATPEVGFRTAGLYWKKNGCNELADQQQFVTITRRINGGTNGLADRQKYYERAKQVLGIGATRGLPRPEGEQPGAPVTRLFTRGLDAPGEITPTAAERNAAAEESAGAAASAGSDRGAGAKSTTTKSKAAKGKATKSAGAKKSASKSAAKKQAARASKKAATGGAKRTAKAAGKKSSAAAKKQSGKKPAKATKKSTRGGSKAGAKKR
jgi:predicted chitinase